jgi:hypothetical protein
MTAASSNSPAEGSLIVDAEKLVERKQNELADIAVAGQCSRIDRTGDLT